MPGLPRRTVARAMRPSIAAAVGRAAISLIALAAVGCTAHPGRAAAPSREEPQCAPASHTASAGRGWATGSRFAVHLDAPAFRRAFPNALEPSADRSGLVGPHTAVGISAVVTVGAINAEQACGIGVAGPVTAAPGYQLLVVHFASYEALQPALRECTEWSGSPPRQCMAPPAVVVVDGRRQPAPAGEFMLVAAALPRPGSPPAELQITDAGRTGPAPPPATRPTRYSPSTCPPPSPPAGSPSPAPARSSHPAVSIGRGSAPAHPPTTPLMGWRSR